MTNKEIVDTYIYNGLLRTSIECQLKGEDAEYRDDLMNDLVVILYQYDNDKLMDAHVNNHFNALVTRIIVNQVYSKTSPYYKKYKKFITHSEEITKMLQDTLADE